MDMCYKNIRLYVNHLVLPCGGDKLMFEVTTRPATVEL
jgi:hypothetical protein